MRRRLLCLDNDGAVLDTIEISTDFERVYLYGASMRIDDFLNAYGPLAEKIGRPETEPYGFWSMGYDPILTREVTEGRYNYDRYDNGREYDGLKALEL